MHRIQIEIIGKPTVIPACYMEKDYKNQSITMTLAGDFSGIREFLKESPIYGYVARATYGEHQLEFEYYQGCGCSREEEDVKKSMRESLFVDAATVVDYPTLDTAEVYKDFADNFGYNPHSIEPFRIWRECKKHYEFLKAVSFTDDEIIETYGNL